MMETELKDVRCEYPFQSAFKCSPQKARALWIKALRSGKYEQHFRSQFVSEFKKNGKWYYSPLGVASAMYAKHEWGFLKSLLLRGTYPDMTTVCRWLAFIPNIGPLSEVTGYMSGYRVNIPYRRNLIEDNDLFRADFSEIADVIEAEPPGLFHPKTLTLGV